MPGKARLGKTNPIPQSNYKFSQGKVKTMHNFITAQVEPAPLPIVILKGDIITLGKFFT
jgi:hypothetical protein